MENDKKETITIPIERYQWLVKCANYIYNWCGQVYECPKCGALNPEGNICINCEYDRTKKNAERKTI